MMIAWMMGVLADPATASGLDRLVGKYSGPMEFRDDKQGKDRSFIVDLEITRPANGAESVWSWKFNFDPPKFSQSFEVSQPLENGTIWHEKGSEDLRFALRNWQQFESGKSNWFEIERKSTRDSEPNLAVVFKRRYTVSAKAFISEKWLKYPAKKWYRSHKMTLNRIAKTTAFASQR